MEKEFEKEKLKNDKDVEITEEKKSDKKSSKKAGGRKFSKKPRHGNGRSTPSDPKDDSIPVRNDKSWYYVNEAIGSSVGNIPYNVFAGEKIDLGVNYNIPNYAVNTFPGVMVLECVDSPGISTDGASAVNIASKALYAYVRHQNSGHSNYESSDLMMYILAMDSIYSAYWEARRIYQTAMTYTYINRNVPDLLLMSMGVNADNIRGNLAQFRAGLNLLAAKISSMAVPNTFNLFKRKAVIYSNVLMDSSSMQAQFYLYRRAYGHKFNAEHTGGGALEAYTINTQTLRTYADILQELTDLIDVIISDEDMNIMSGDILKAFGRENLFVVAGVDEDSTTTFIEDEDLLAQIENASSEVPSGNLDIYQENNIIKFNPAFDRTNILNSRYFNSHKTNPDWKDTLEWSRCITMNGSCGSELIVRFSIHTWRYEATNNWNRIYVYRDFATCNGLMNGSGTEVLSNIRDVTMLISNFDWHPIIYIFKNFNFSDDQSSEPNEFFGVMGDINKCTVISTDTVKRLNDSALMGEFNTLLLSKVSKY